MLYSKKEKNILIRTGDYSSMVNMNKGDVVLINDDDQSDFIEVGKTIKEEQESINHEVDKVIYGNIFRPNKKLTRKIKK